MSVPPTSAAAPAVRAWRYACVILACVLAALALAHRRTLATIVYHWDEDPFGHGYFVVPAALWIVWTRRHQLLAVEPSPAPRVLVLVAVLSSIAVGGQTSDVLLAQQLAVAGIFVAASWAILGTAAARVLAFPAGLAIFAIPVGDLIAPLLQQLTATLVAMMLQLSAVDIVHRGEIILTSATRWHVSQDCGGIHYVVASLGVGYVYAGTVYRAWTRRLAFLAAAAAIPVAGNLLRVYGTIVLDELGATTLVEGTGHELFGVLVFAAMMMALFATCGFWREPVAAPRAAAAVDARASAFGTWRAIAVASAAVLLAMIGRAMAAAGAAIAPS